MLKKNMCDTYSSYNSGNLNESDYQMHIIKKERARQEKEDDKKRAAAGFIHTFDHGFRGCEGLPLPYC
ncbi:unnamed protein product [Colias eurytheme]|nr:unnamed protein product [Colias eurytheme]